MSAFEKWWMAYELGEFDPDWPKAVKAAYNAGLERAAEIAESDLMFGDIDTCAELAAAIRAEKGE